MMADTPLIPDTCRPIPDRVIAAARAYIGRPWHHQARGAGSNAVALDCAGLLVAAARDCGLEAIDLEAYARVPTRTSLNQALARNARRVPWAERRQGDIVLMGRPSPSHLGLITAPEWMIHCPAGGSVCEVALDKRQVRGVYRPNVFREDI